jgi:hypothetical protein
MAEDLNKLRHSLRFFFKVNLIHEAFEEAALGNRPYENEVKLRILFYILMHERIKLRKDFIMNETVFITLIIFSFS